MTKDDPRDAIIARLREALVWIELSAIKQDHPAPALLLDSIKRRATVATGLADGSIWRAVAVAATTVIVIAAECSARKGEG